MTPCEVHVMSGAVNFTYKHTLVKFKNKHLNWAQAVNLALSVCN